MRLSILACLALAVLSDALADTAKDWHKPLAGIPLTHTRSLAPRFHRRLEGRSSHSHVYVATEKNALAALQPNNGTLAWRHIYDDSDRIANFKAHSHFVTTLSGPGGANLRILEAARGHVLWEIPLHEATLGKLTEPVDAGTDIVYSPDGVDIFVLSNSNSVRRVRIPDGTTAWTWSASDSVSLNLHSRIALSGPNLYVISLSKSFASYTLHVAVLDAFTGKETVSYAVPSSVQNGLADVLVLDYPADPSVLWVEKSAIKHLSLLNRKVTTLPGKNYGKLVDVGLSDHGMFVALHADETAVVFKADGKDGKEPALVYTFTDSAPSDKQSSSIYSGGLDKDGKPYISRVFYAFAAQAAALSLYIPQGHGGKGHVAVVALEYDTMSHGVINHVALDVADLGEDKYLSRAVLTTSMGSIQLWKGFQHSWTREESLSELQSVEIVDLPEKSVLEGSGAVHQLEALAKGVIGTIGNIGALSANIAETLNGVLVEFISGRKPTPPKPASSAAAELGLEAPVTPTVLFRDEFGFTKVIVAITSTGKIFGINSATGALLWGRILGLDMGLIVPNPSLHVIRSVLDGALAPVVAVVANRQNGASSVVVHLDAVTGKVQPTGALPGHFASNMVSEVLPIPRLNRSLLLVDKEHKAAIYTASTSIISALSTPSSFPSLYFTKLSGTPLHTTLTGYHVEPASSASAAVLESKPVWDIKFGPDESIEYTFKPPRGAAVASLGKVLIDRTTLYKYLNSHIVGVVTKSQSASQGGSSAIAPGPQAHSIYLVDGVTGAVLYHSTVHASAGTKVLTTIAENWLVYTYVAAPTLAEGEASAGGDEGARGQHIVSVELYEGSAKDDRTRSSELSSHSPEVERLTVYAKSFILPHNVETLAMTSTKYGISAKDLIVSTTEGQIQSFPRRLLDPRRHKEKPSAADAEEQLIPYEPLVGDDHRRVLSHDSEVAGVKHILTSPALLESTSLIFAYGHDLFFTRIAPSGTFDLLSETFNKIQLIVIIVALSAGIIVVRPIVQRRQLKQQWYS